MMYVSFKLFLFLHLFHHLFFFFFFFFFFLNCSDLFGFLFLSFFFPRNSFTLFELVPFLPASSCQLGAASPCCYHLHSPSQPLVTVLEESAQRSRLPSPRCFALCLLLLSQNSVHCLGPLPLQFWARLTLQCPAFPRQPTSFHPAHQSQRRLCSPSPAHRHRIFLRHRWRWQWRWKHSSAA